MYTRLVNGVFNRIMGRVAGVVAALADRSCVQSVRCEFARKNTTSFMGFCWAHIAFLHEPQPG